MTGLENVPDNMTGLLKFLAERGNDLERPAIALHPVIGKVLEALRALPQCRLARMSGSGATCFALCESINAATSAARALHAAYPGWWVHAVRLDGT